MNGSKTDYVDVDPFNWARNKNTFYELDYRSKTRTEHQYPVDPDGNPQIRFLGFFVVTLPLTDIFRLDPAGLPDRFWIRPVAVTTGKHDRWLELFPKTVADARQFSSLLVALSESDWDISGIDIRAPNYSEKTNPVHTSIEFRNRTGPTAVPGLLTKILARPDSCVPSVPRGWRRVVEGVRDPGERE